MHNVRHEDFMTEKFFRFVLLTEKEGHISGLNREEILINPRHLVSIKPIKIMDENNNIYDGHWLRTSNGKKYKAIEIPEELKLQFTPIPEDTDSNDQISFVQ